MDIKVLSTFHLHDIGSSHCDYVLPSSDSTIAALGLFHHGAFPCRARSFERFAITLPTS